MHFKHEFTDNKCAHLLCALVFGALIASPATFVGLSCGKNSKDHTQSPEAIWGGVIQGTMHLI
jgi:hypothetical protein